jgi:hypothetical protein
MITYFKWKNKNLYFTQIIYKNIEANFKFCLLIIRKKIEKLSIQNKSKRNNYIKIIIIYKCNIFEYASKMMTSLFELNLT